MGYGACISGICPTTFLFFGDKMKLKCTINIGNYNNISIESSEYDNVVYAKNEIRNIAENISEPAVKDFVKKYF